MWSTGDTTKQIKILKPGKYWLNLTKPCGSGSDTFNVNFLHNIPVKLPRDTTICAGDSFNISVFEPGATYKWSTGSDSSNFTFLDGGIYWVKRIQQGCTSSDTIQIKVNQPPSINLGKDTIVCENEVYLNPAIIKNADRIEWQDGSSKNYYLARTSGKYSAVVSNSCGIASDTVEITFADCHCSLYAPNSFTPNNDTLNDGFRPLGCDLPIQNYSFMIFNRWGERVFTTENYNEFWDGKFKNADCETGVYLYIVQYKFKYNIPKILEGTITLLR